MMTMKSFFRQTVIAIGIVTAFSYRPALADLTSSSPDANSIISLHDARIVNQIDLRFSEDINLDGSRFAVIGPHGHLFTTIGQDINVKSVVFLSLWKEVFPGRYTVQWQTISTNKHRSRGSLTFTVSTKAATASKSAISEPIKLPDEPKSP
jgi:methionine-rich copper-binding protein CopC